MRSMIAWDAMYEKVASPGSEWTFKQKSRSAMKQDAFHNQQEQPISSPCA